MNNAILTRLLEEKEANLPGGFYHKLQIDFAYNSNHMEGSGLTHDQTRYIYETSTIEPADGTVKVDDIIETVNHFRCFDYILEHIDEPLTEEQIKELHSILKTGTTDSRKEWFRVGDYKKLPNEVGGQETAAPKDVPEKMRELLSAYREAGAYDLETIVGFHAQLERIHPFQDGNGRIGRLIMFRECLRHNIIPFIITDEIKLYYYRGLREWNQEKGYLMDTCLTAQDYMKKIIDYFEISGC